jgi:hypothetical protein
MEKLCLSPNKSFKNENKLKKRKIKKEKRKTKKFNIN